MNVREEAWAKVLIINNDLVCKLNKKSRIVWSSFQLHECSMSFCYISVQSLSRVRLFATPCIAARQASLSITNSRSLLKPMPIESVMPSSRLILCRPLLLLPQSLPASGSFPMSQLFAWGGQSIGVSASASVLPVNTQDWSPLGWIGYIWEASFQIDTPCLNWVTPYWVIFEIEVSCRGTPKFFVLLLPNTSELSLFRDSVYIHHFWDLVPLSQSHW